MTVEQWAAGVGFVLPILVAIINREEWKPWLKAVVSLLASVAGGTVTALLGGEFTGANWLTAIGVAFGASQVFYHTWWKNSDITSWIEQTINVVSRKVIPGESVVVEEGTPGGSLR